MDTKLKIMNRYTIITLIVAPFLAIGGYIASGYYADAQMTKQPPAEKSWWVNVTGWKPRIRID